MSRHGPVALCGIGECGRPRKSRGWCGTHYARFLKYGDPLPNWKIGAPPQNVPPTSHAHSIYPTCDGPCGRPLRTSKERLADHPGTVSAWADGMCQTCARKHREGASATSDLDRFDPHRVAIEAGTPLADLVVFPPPLPTRHPVECRFCVWDKIAPTHVVARSWAYKHFNSFLEKHNV